jgi:hypothetical protein
MSGRHTGGEAALFEFGLLVAAGRNDLGDGAAGSAEFDRDHAGIADDFATVGLVSTFLKPKTFS